MNVKPNYLSEINHLNYAMTWFMLAVTLSIIFIIFMRRKKMFKNTRLVIKILSGFLGLTIVTQILLGAWVRLTNSGMSCPDWPLCYGLLFPSYQKITELGVIEYSYFQIFLEWIHRANAAFIIGPLAIILFLYIILNKKLDKIFKTYSFYLIALLGIQGLFGGLTVMKSNIPWSVALHLASAFFYSL